MIQRLRDSDILKWFYPGMHVKRWLALMMLGVVIMGLGGAYVLREAYVSYTFPGFVYYLTLQFIPRIWRGVMFMAASVSLILFALWHLNHSILSAVLPQRRQGSLISIIHSRRFLRRGPKIVAIGGGTGLSTLLRGLKEYSGNLIAIVTVADDGGSSGRLRKELGILPPGDVRNCIAALADAEPLMTKLFQYRFSDGSGLAGHSFGNLFIVAMSGVVGNFEEAIKQTSRVLAVRGQIIPSTLANVTLNAITEDEETIEGESNITGSDSRIKEVYLLPDNPQASPEAIRAILEADMIVVGPGSLFTSVLPNLLGGRHPTEHQGLGRRQGLRLQRGHPARRDGRLRRGRPRAGAGEPCGQGPVPVRAGQQQHRQRLARGLRAGADRRRLRPAHPPNVRGRGERR